MKNENSHKQLVFTLNPREILEAVSYQLFLEFMTRQDPSLGNQEKTKLP